ncbi:polyhydroxyalkanoate depolymerase [Caenispirillum salinarum]|uniref:polyhydroxyalkanoate depolymerase n=1 Tax=Caenispirillum salinarum TaxID=859058 RepID=UPI00384D5A8A
MLYQLHEFQHAAMAPMRAMAHAVHQVYSNPWLPVSYTRVAKTLVATADVFERATRKYPKPHFDLPTTTVDNSAVPVVEENALELPFCHLKHFKRMGVDTDHPRVLVVAPLSGHYATLLRGTVEALLPEHDVYITDWINARDVPLSAGKFCLDTYVDYVRAFLRHLGPNTHVMAVCQPAVPVTAAAALMAEDEEPCRPASVTLMGGPIDTRANPTAVNDFATEKDMDWFHNHVIHTVPVHYEGRMRKVYPGFLQLSGFMSMNMDRHMDAHLRYFRHLIRGDGDSAEGHRKFYDEYMSVMDLPAEFYLQTIRKVFKEWQLPRGELEIDGRKVDLAAVRDIAFMSVEGEKDDITGVGQTKAVHDLLVNLPESKQRYYLQPKVGHYGIFNGRRWREEILPHVRTFIREHDKALLGNEAA